MKNKIMKTINKVTKWNMEGTAYDKKSGVEMNFAEDTKSTIEHTIVAKIGNYDVIEDLTSKKGPKDIAVNVQTGFEIGARPSLHSNEEKQTIVDCINKQKLLNAFTFYDCSSLSSLLRCSNLSACYKAVKEKIKEKIEESGTLVIFFPDIVIISEDGRVRTEKVKVNLLIVCPELEKVTETYLKGLKESSFLPFISQLKSIPEGVSNIFELEGLDKAEKRQIQFYYIFEQVKDAITSLSLPYVAIDPYFYSKFRKFKTLINQLWMNLLINNEDAEFSNKVYYIDFYCEDDVDTLYYLKTFDKEVQKKDIDD